MAWQLDEANAAPGIHRVAVKRDGFVSTGMPFALDTLPESFEKEPNNDPSLPVYGT